MLTWLRTLAPRDLRAFVALMASIGGTMALTVLIVGVIYILWRGGWAVGTELARIDKIGLIAILLTVIMGVTMTGLGLAINRRVLKANVGGSGFEASGGDDVPAAAQAVADTAQHTADIIKEESRP